MKMTKKGQAMQQLGALGVGVATLAITMAVVFLILSETSSNSSVAADGNATAGLATLTSAVADIPGWVPLIIIAVVGAILLGLISLFRQ